MERQDGRLVVDAVAGAPLERLADAPVDLAAAAERQALVGGGAEEVVPEAQDVVAVPADELAEPPPALEIAHVLDLARRATSLSSSRSKLGPITDA